MSDGTVVLIGGTAGIGKEVARHYADAGRPVVISGRDPERSAKIASELGVDVTGVGFDLAEPGTIAPALAEVGTVDHLVLAALDRDHNAVRDYDVAAAIRLVTLKLVGYTEVVHALSSRMHDGSSIVIFGGLAKDRPYPGSTTITTINHGVDGLVRTLSVELAPIRVNAVHPGIVADSPYWAEKPDRVEAAIARQTVKRPIAMADVVDATVFLLENPSMAGTDLRIDAGWSLPL